ncbi:hypothetical protein HPP92_000928 [Vanilla planifolia]|uniref:Pentatricopeptide repeat-containing protein n=1 Tax=Vanilla planifolia TaxID=51239 RepID=A0A835RYY4_VANPL|nr:hypothetical protein HPP92_000928 [Vanilla planifolia]
MVNPGRLLLLNSMLSVFASNGYNIHALHLISKIHSTEVMLDSFTLSITLKICINMNAVRIGLQVHGLIITTGHHVDVVVGSVLVDQYAKFGSLEEALKIFSGLPQKDLISWTCLITSCVERGSNQLAFSLFREMMSLNCEVDHFVVSIISKACAAISWLQGGEQLHALCTKGGFEMENATLTSLIDLYSKCGGIEDALKLFCNAPEKDTICWTGIIAGCGYNGRTDEAIQLFHKMLESKEEQPNEITFLGILSACKHAGLVREATTFFEVMQQKLGLKPSMDHYCCMVDILGRAGLFDEALQLISNMHCEAEETIWNSMLGSAMIHENIDIGKLALLHLHMICREKASWYVSLSKVYASLNQWEGSAHMRELAFGVNMKEPGKSWTELRN